mgnify:FL=1|tara:strand:- start:50 stop:673 length:624 start_codon:yes stop_codon:yes gene_type:complete
MLSQILESVNKKYVNSVKGDYWEGSHFEDIVKLTNDERGKWGEELFRDLIKYPTIEMPVMWDADKNTDPTDGVYDMFIESNSGDKLRIEVKTSGRTISKGKPVGWQHENIYFGGNKWDKLVFVDYDADDVMYITIVDYNQVVTNGQIDLSLFGKNGHCRKNEDGKAKVDFSMKSLQNGIDVGVTFKYDINNSKCWSDWQSFARRSLL